MYGMVNRAIEDLIMSTHGQSTWDEIKLKAGLKDLQFFDTTTYDDKLTYDLVTASSEILGHAAADILHAFGRHWVLYTGREGWAALFDSAGDNFIDFIKQLDEMHARVNAAMPAARMPEFSLREHGENYELIYRTDRDGLAPMVMGILDGLAEQFDESWYISQSATKEECGFDAFSLCHVENKSALDDSEAA